MSDDLVKRLCGQYAIGPHLPNGEPEFGYRQFEAPPVQHEAAARIRALEAENAALREAGGVQVKPLVWLCHRDPKDTSEARTQVGSWTVWEINGSAYCHGPNDTCGKPCDGGINGDKAAAQADYERRILAALEPAPVTVGEAARVLLDESVRETQKAVYAACEGRVKVYKFMAVLRALTYAGEAG